MTEARSDPAIGPDFEAAQGWSRRIVFRSFLVGGFASILRLVWVLRFGRPPRGSGDPAFYLQFARQIANGSGYSYADGYPTAYYPPGYPYFLGAIRWMLDIVGQGSHMVSTTLVVQALLGGATAGLIVVLAAESTRDLLGDRGAVVAATTAGLLFATWPNQVVQTGLVLSEALFLFLFVSLFVVLARVVMDADVTKNRHTGRLVLLGAVFGACNLVRPQSTLLLLPAIPLVLVLCRWPWKRALRVGAVLVVALLVVLTPWTIRNALRMDAFIPLTTNTGDNLCIGFGPNAHGGFHIAQECLLEDDTLDRPTIEVRRNQQNAKQAITWALDNPAGVLRLSVSKVWRTMNNDVDALWGLQSFGNDVFIADQTFANMKHGANIYYIAVLFLGSVGLIAAARRSRASRAPNTSLWLVFTVIPTGLVVPVLSFGDPRFKAPLIPAMVVFAGVATAAVTTWFSGRGQRAVDTSDGATAP